MKTSPNIKRSDQEIKDSSLKCLTRKHLAERQRRARINKLLENLESLVLPEDPESNPVKLEKAEVLERTVEYVKNLTNKQKDFKSSYNRGYMECMRSICTFLNQSNMPSAQVDRMHSYLLSHVTNEQFNGANGQNLVPNGHLNTRSCFQQTVSYTHSTQPMVTDLSNQTGFYGLSFDSEEVQSPTRAMIACPQTPVLASVNGGQSQCSTEVLQDVTLQRATNNFNFTTERAAMLQQRHPENKMWRPW